MCRSCNLPFHVCYNIGMAAKTLDILDSETGEVVTGQLRVASRPKRIAPFKEYIIVDKNTDLSYIKHASTLRVYLKLQHILGYENALEINKTALAKEMGMSRQQFWRAMTELLEEKVIEECVTEGLAITYRMSPKVMWRGSAHSFDKAVGRDMKANR